MVDVVADVGCDRGAEEGRNGAECGYCADPKTGLREIVGDPGLRGDAREDTDVDDGFGRDDPVEAAVEELVKNTSSVPRSRCSETNGGKDVPVRSLQEGAVR